MYKLCIKLIGIILICGLFCGQAEQSFIINMVVDIESEMLYLALFYPVIKLRVYYFELSWVIIICTWIHLCYYFDVVNFKLICAFAISSTLNKIIDMNNLSS